MSEEEKNPRSGRRTDRRVLLGVAILVLVVGVAGTTFQLNRDHGSSGTSPAVTASGSPRATPSRSAPATTAKPTATPKPSLVAVSIPTSGPKTYRRATVRQKPATSTGRLITFDVRVEKGLPYSANEVARTIEKTLNDKRSWRGDGTVRFELVSGKSHADYHAYLATPTTTNSLCAPLGTHGDLSCRNGAKVVLNAERWAFAEPWFNGDVVGYREYLVNHEFGHAIGYEHKKCPGKGKVAPVMMQQTKGLDGCKPNSWPYPKK